MKPSGEPKTAAKKPTTKRVSPVAEIELFTYQPGARDALMSSNFLENTERLSKYALANYGDLGKIIKDQKYPTIPRTLIDRADEAYTDLSAARIDKMQSVLDQEWAKDMKKMNDQKTRLFGFLMQLLTEEGEERIKTYTEDWLEIERICEPLKLWKAIITTHGLRTDNLSGAEAKRSARVGYTRCYQQGGESLLNFVNRFRQCVSIMEAVGETKPSEETLAIDFLEALDKRVYGEMLRDLKNRSRNGEAEFPNSLITANTYVKNYIPPYVRRNDNTGSKSVYLTENEAVVSVPLSDSRPPKKSCSECGRFHYGACWGRNRERSPFVIGAKVVNVIDGSDMHVNNKKVKDSESHDDGSDCYIDEPIKEGIKENIDIDITNIIYKCNSGSNEDYYMENSMVVYLDSCANAHVMHNIELLRDVRHDTESEIRVKGVGGEAVLRNVGVLPCFGEVHVLESTENRVNILSLGKVQDLYTVEFIKGNFYVTINKDVVIVFQRMENDLWGCDFREILPILRRVENNSQIVLMNETVMERERLFSTAEVKRAKMARELMRQLGYPSTRDLIKIIVKGMMVNIPVTAQDVIRAEKIYGPDAASLKGKTVKRKPREQPKVYVPRAMMKRQDMFSDIFYWRGVGFMLSIVMPLRIKFITVLTKSETKSYLKTVLEDHIVRMKGHGYEVRTIYVDPQGALSALTTLGVVVDTSGARRHVSIIERAIRIVKERMRATECGLPFKCARRLVKGLAYFVVSRLNMFPSSDQRDGVSPRELYTGIKPDYDREVRELSFGDYIQAHEDFDTNTNLPRERTRGCIALFSKGNAAGSWKMYSLKTDMEITRDNWTPLPMPDVVIDRMNALYDADEKTNSKIMRPFVEDAGIVVNDASHQNTNISDLLEPEVLNEMQQFDPDGIDIENDEEAQSFPIGHEEEPIPVSKKSRAIEATNNIFVPDTYQGEQHMFDEDNASDRDEDLVESTPDILGSVVVEGVRKSGRILNRRYVNVIQRIRHVRHVKRTTPIHYVFSLTRTQAYQKYATEAEMAAVKEMTQIYDRGTLKILDRKLMTMPQLRRLIHSALIFDDKYDINGKFERLKARLVARGNEMDETLYENRSSPTISTIHVMILVAIAAKEKRKIRILDIGNAFLEADMKSGEDVYVELDQVSSRILSMIDSSITTLMGENGKFVARLDKALYGCIQSARLWFDKLTEVLVAYGFTANPCDECVMNKFINGKQISIGFHVDDLLMTCEEDNMLDDVIMYLRTLFREVKVKKDDVMGYLGMRLTIKEDDVYVDMDTYTAKILDEFGIGGHAPTPSNEDLFNDREVPFLGEVGRKRFHSAVAKLLFLAKRTRPDILLTISHLASRVTIANEDDLAKLNRVLRYLNGNAKMSLHFRRDGDMILRAFIDASFAIHADGTSRTGMIIQFGGATICAWTSKQKMTTKSACEAELVGLSDGSSEVLGCREFLQYQGYNMGPAIIYQDNTSVLDLIVAGHPTSHRTRHLKARYFFIKDYIKASEIVLQHMGTEWMLADYLTKPLSGEKFKGFLELIIGLVHTPV